jgi:ClpP class serine protease
MDINDEDKNGFMACCHKIDKKKGLDLFLHTPGGKIGAAESLVNYLKQMFGNDIRAFVPQLAMSAGTMIACSCKEIVMGKHSNLGPFDPFINGLSAAAVLGEIETAHKEMTADNRRAFVGTLFCLDIPQALCSSVSGRWIGLKLSGLVFSPKICCPAIRIKTCWPLR